MCVLCGLPGPSNVDMMSAPSFQYGYCQCAWQSWCWQHNRDCWPCASVWSAGFAQGEAAEAEAAAAARASVEALSPKQDALSPKQDSVEMHQRDRSFSMDEEMINQYEADLLQFETSRDADAAEAAARKEARAEKKAAKKAAKKADKKSKAEGSGGGAAEKKSKAARKAAKEADKNANEKSKAEGWGGGAAQKKSKAAKKAAKKADWADELVIAIEGADDEPNYGSQQKHIKHWSTPRFRLLSSSM